MEVVLLIWSSARLEGVGTVRKSGYFNAKLSNITLLKCHTLFIFMYLLDVLNISLPNLCSV